MPSEGHRRYVIANGQLIAGNPSLPVWGERLRTHNPPRFNSRGCSYRLSYHTDEQLGEY